MSARFDIDLSDAYENSQPMNFSDATDTSAPDRPRLKNSYDDLIEKHARANKLDPDLIRAVMGKESRGHPDAVSPKGARGLMQLMPGTAQRFGVRDIHDPDQNISGGSKYLRYLLDRFHGDVPKVLAGYNAGEGAVDKFGGIPPYRETQEYVRTITGKYKGKGYAGTPQATESKPQIDLSDAYENSTPISSELPAMPDDSRAALRNQLGLQQPTYAGSRTIDRTPVDFSDDEPSRDEMQATAASTSVIAPNASPDPTATRTSTLRPLTEHEASRTDEFAPASNGVFQEQQKRNAISEISDQAVALNRARRVARRQRLNQLRERQRQVQQQRLNEVERQRQAEEIRAANQQAVTGAVGLPPSTPEAPEVFKQPQGKGFTFAQGYRPAPSYTKQPLVEPYQPKQGMSRDDLRRALRQQIKDSGIEYSGQVSESDLDGMADYRLNALEAESATQARIAASLTPEDHQEVQRLTQLFTNRPLYRRAISLGLDRSADNIPQMATGIWRMIADATGSKNIRKLADEGMQSTLVRKMAEEATTQKLSTTEQRIAAGTDLIGNLIQLAALSEVAGPEAVLGAQGGLSTLGQGGSYSKAAGETGKGILYGRFFKTLPYLEPYKGAQGALQRLANLSTDIGLVGTGTYAIERATGASHQQALKSALQNSALSGFLRATDVIRTVQQGAASASGALRKPAFGEAVEPEPGARVQVRQPDGSVAVGNVPEVSKYPVTPEGTVPVELESGQSVVANIRDVKIVPEPKGRLTTGEKESALDNLRQAPDEASFNVAVNQARQAGVTEEEINTALKPTVPESKATLAAQEESARSPESPRAAIFYPKSSGVPETQSGFIRVPLPDGFLLLNRKKARSLGLGSIRSIQDYVAQNGIEPLIGKVAPVQDTSQGVALRTEDAEGRELSTSIVLTPEVAQAQAEVDRAQFPQATNQEVMPAQDAAARRVEETSRIDFSDAEGVNDEPAKAMRESAGIGDSVQSNVSPASVASGYTVARGTDKRSTVETTVATPTSSEQQPARQWRHADFGLVTEVENQKGVAAGKVRVVDKQGQEHAIWPSNGRGEGNSLAVPVRRGLVIEQAPVETQPQPVSEIGSPQAEARARAIRELEKLRREADLRRADESRTTPTTTEQKISGKHEATIPRSEPQSDVVEAAPAEAKEPRQQTKREFVGELSKDVQRGDTLKGKTLRHENRTEFHKSLIKEAQAQGEAIPPEVLADYPDLKAKELKPPLHPVEDFAISQSDWNEIRRTAPYVSKSNPDTLVTISPSTTRPGWTRLNFWNHQGIWTHLEMPDADVEKTLKQQTYPRHQVIVSVKGGMGGSLPSESYAGFGFEPYTTGAKGIKAFVGPRESVSWMTDRLGSGGYKVEVRDVPEQTVNQVSSPPAIKEQGQGTALTAYRGGSTEPADLSIEKAGIGTKGKAVYLGYDQAKAAAFARGDKKIKEVGLKLDHPLDMRRPDVVRGFINNLEAVLQGGESSPEFQALARRVGEKGITKNPQTLYKNLSNLVRVTKDVGGAEMVEPWDQNANLSAIAEHMGYDGILGVDEIAVFNPRQSISAPPVEHTPLEPKERRKLIKGLGGTKAQTQFGEAGKLSDADLRRLTTEPSAEKPTTESTDLAPGTRSLIDTIKQRLKTTGIKDNPELTRLADEAFGGTRAKGTYEPKDSYDALETAVNEYLAENAKALMEGDPKEALQTLRALLKKLPTQTDRTQEQQELQQFSTPPTESFVAAKALAPTSSDVVLEPSAGTGSLASWPKAMGAKVYANEISPRRRALLEAQGFETTNVDAQFLDDLLPEEIRPTAIIMNPPFSATGGRVAKNKTIYGAEHVTDALKRLEPNGRLVAIVGEGMGLDRPAFREWWSKVFKEYNVRANISVPGEEYGKYGTTFGNQLLVIDKTGATPGDTLVEQMGNVISSSPADLEGVLDALEPIINDRPLATTSPSVRRSGGRSPIETTTRGGGESLRARNKPGRTPDQNPPSEAGGSRAAVPESQPTDQPSESRPGETVESSGSDDLNVRQQLETPIAEEEDSGNFVRYRPAKLKGGTRHPGIIVESASMAAVDPPDITYKPKLDPEVFKQGKLSDIQYEAVSYAGQRHEQRLPNGNRAAMFVGDGTGVGKGRILAGVTLDNWNQGRRRIVWMSVNTDLVPSTQRDLNDLGAKDIPLAVINDFSAQAKQLEFGDGVLFVAYPTLVKTAQNGQTRMDQIRDWLGDDGLILLDEAHLAKNAVTEGMKESSQRGEKIVALQEGEQTNPNWRFVYASATGATEVSNMGYMARLGLWGEGTSFPGGFAEFRAAIDGGGVGAMEMVSRDMKAMGMYLSRTLSFKGVSYREAVHSLTPTQRDLYDTSARAWQLVLQNVEKALEVTNADSRAKMHAKRRFWNDQQRFFRQFITALKVPTAIKEIDKALDGGNSVVLGLYGTGEARTSEQVKKALAVGADLEELDFSPKEILRNLVSKAFPTQRYTEQSDPNNPSKIIKVPVTDSDGRPVESTQAKRMRDDLLEELDHLALPENPLDQIVNHFGPDRVAEITGRSKRLVRNPETGKNEYVKRVSGVSMEKASQHEMDAFQEGRKRIAIISASASTGISLHADNTRQNQQRRSHITLETGWSADIQMQTFGRTHRSNEASQPEYVLLATNVGGEKRFLSTIAKRLASLGALTKGERKATGMGSSEEGLEKYDFMNEYGRAAIHSIVDQVRMSRGPAGINTMEVWRQMGLVKEKDTGTEVEEPDVERFLNRILALELDKQNIMFDWFTQTFSRVVEQAKESGTFDEGVTDVKGDSIRMVGEPQVVAKDKTTGAETIHYQLEVDEKTKPVSFDSIDKQTGEFYKQNRSGNIIFTSEAGSRTDASGNVTRRFFVTKPSAAREHLIDQPDLATKYSKITPAEAKDWWTAEFEADPGVRTKETHLIGGAIIPVWQRLQQRDATGQSVQLKVVRLVADDGQRVVGVRIPTRSVGDILRVIGVQRSFKEPAQIFKSVYEQGEKVNLVSGLSLERTRFKGDDAVEVKGFDSYKVKELKNMGLKHEIVNYDDRLFVPTNEKVGVEVLTKLLERYPATGSDAALKMARVEKKPDLRGLENAAALVPDIAIERDADILKVNDSGQEFLRRTLEQNHINRGEAEGAAESPFKAIFLEPSQVRETIKTLHQTADELQRKGYTEEEAKKLENLAEQTLAAARAGKGTAIVMLSDAPQSALPHESFHQGGHLGSGGKSVDDQLYPEDIEELGATEDADAWREYYKGTPEYKNARPALVVAEVAATYAGGDYAKMGRTRKQAREFLKKYFAAFTRRNGVLSLEEFRRQREDVKQIIEEEKARTTNPPEEARPVDRSIRGTPAPPGEVAESTGQSTRPLSTEAGTEESNLKHRSLPRTLRAKGLEAADQLYETYPNKAALADAKKLFDRLGFNAAEALLKSDRQKGAEDMALSDLLQRALLNAASEASTTDPELAASLRQRQQDLASTLAAQATRAGQFIQAAQASAHSVEDVLATAERVAKERGTPLTEAEVKRIQEAGEQLERATAEVEVAGVDAGDMIAEVEANNEALSRAEEGLLTKDEVERLKDRLKELKERETQRTKEGADLAGKLATMRERLASLAGKEKRREQRVAELEGKLPPRERKARASRVQARQKAIELLSANEADLMADLHSLLGGTSPLKMAERRDVQTTTEIDDDVIHKLAQVGALRLLRAERGTLSVSEFKRGMIKDFGSRIKPQIDRIHAEAVRLQRQTLKRVRYERTLERIASREGNEELSRDELETIAENERQEARRAALVRSEHDRAAREYQKSQGEVKAKDTSRAEFSKAQTFVRGIARQASGAYQRTVGGELLSSRALAQAIGRNAQTDIEAIAAAKLAMRPQSFTAEMKAEHHLTNEQIRAAFRDGGRVLENSMKEINGSRQMTAALKKRVINSEAERDQALADLQGKRKGQAQAKRQVARQLESLRTSAAERLAKRVWRESKGIPIALMASGDMSSFLRQGGASIAMQPALAPDFAAALFKSIGRKGHAKLINKIEKGKDFTLKQRVGVDFAFAGRGGEGGDEFFENAELLERIPGIKQWVEASDRVFGGSLDELRDSLADVLIADLRSKGISYAKNPKAYKDIGRFINIITGRADIGSHNAALTKAFLFIGRAIGFAPRYRISRMQFLTLPLNRSFWHAAPPARRVIYKNYARWFGTMGAVYGILAALGWLTGGILSTYFDPDDDDFLKLKVGKARFDITGGLQVPARFIGRLLLEGYRGLTKEVTPEMAGKQMLNITGRYLYSGLDPRASLAVEWWNQQTYDKRPFTWFGDYGIDGALGTRLTPINVSQALETGKREGKGYAAAQYGAEFLGAGTNVYPDRADEPRTKAEKLATRFAYKNDYTSSGQAIDEETKRKLDELKGRARGGEDVSGEVSQLVEADKINERKADSIINAKDQTYLQEKFRQLSLEDARHVLKYATPEEKEAVAEIMRGKELNAAEKQAKEEEKRENPERTAIKKERAKRAQERRRRRQELRYGDRIDFTQ